MKNRKARAVPKRSRNDKKIETDQHEENPGEIDLPPNPTRDLPPNENIRKHPDEVYGDTMIPHRRHR
jgi:hypothetical protein